MVEPFAAERLRLALGERAAAARPSADRPSADRETPLLAALEPPPVPSAALAAAIAACPECRADARCAAHAAAWRDERWRDELARHRRGERHAAGYADFRERALHAVPASSACLTVLRAQADALAQVWEAHERGAVALPAPVLEAVLAARRALREQAVLPA